MAEKTGRRRRTSKSSRSAPVLQARGLSKRYGKRVALDAIDFSAGRGELLAVTGPNGAGKTTLLSILAGTVRPDEGEVEGPAGEIGWVPQMRAIYRRLTVAENLRLFARLEDVEDVEGVVEEMLAEIGLDERRDELVGTLSGGNQQRVNIAVGLLARPEVLLLDEPSAGLDPRQRARLWEFVSRLAAAGTTVIFTTHHIGETERYGDRLLVLADGEALFEGTMRQLRSAARDAGGKGSGRGGRAPDSETAFVNLLTARGH